MSVLYKHGDQVDHYQIAATCDKYLRTYKTTPFIITFCETYITEFDIHSLIELGLRVVRFKITNLTNGDKLNLILMLDRALKWYCEKYDVPSWPVALNMDIPNAIIKTGFVGKELAIRQHLIIKDNSIVELTSDIKYWTKCDEHRIFIDDPYTMPYLVPGTEITIDLGTIVMTCIEKIDDKNIKCKVLKGGVMKDEEFVCVRGIKHAKPPLTKRDIEMIDFAKSCKFDIVTINSVRHPETVQKVRSLFTDPVPLMVSTICEQEGLDNVDAIIKASNGIILAREFLAHEIKEKYKMIGIQLQVNAKCKKYGKPFYISGHIMDNILLSDMMTGCDLNDITNAVLQGSGLILRKFQDPKHLIRAMHVLNNVCKAAEPLTQGHQFWRLSMEYQIPVNAGEAAVLSAVLLAKMTNSMVIIIPTVTGRTVKQVVHMSSDAIIIAITSSATVARQLQLFKGVIAIIYDKKSLRNWKLEMDARIKFAVEYGIKFEVLQYGGYYVILRKSNQTVSYCDHVSAFQALSLEERNRLEITLRKSVQLDERPVINLLPPHAPT